VRLSRAIRATACGVVAAGVAAPLLRKRVNAAPIVLQTVAYAAPVALCVAAPRSRTRDVATCTLQMWAYLAAYKSPHDDPDAQQERVRVRYPIAVDRVLGLGELPTVRLQRSLARIGPDGKQDWDTLDRVLVWAHWSWFFVPHGTVAYMLARHPERFSRAAAMTYAVFNLGAIVYWVVPTAPPWYAASLEANSRPQPPAVRRMMVEYGEFFWRDGWGSLYSVFGGNPLAAMPSLHFATSVMAALLLAEVGPLPGALGVGYAATLGFALVYLGEHYVVDLLAGAALTGAVRRLAPRAGPALAGMGRAVAALEAMAHEAV
jgi:membrane-associated phospholipid phosphatase